MGRTLRIITLVAVSGEDICLAAGEEWELPEASARERIRLGLARPLPDPEPTIETAMIEPAGERRARRRVSRKGATDA